MLTLAIGVVLANSISNIVSYLTTQLKDVKSQWIDQIDLLSCLFIIVNQYNGFFQVATAKF